MHLVHGILEVAVVTLPNAEHLFTTDVREDVGLILLKSRDDPARGFVRAGLVHLEVLCHVGVDGAGVDGVHADAARRQFDTQPLRHRKQRGLGCAIATQTREIDKRGNGDDVDDRGRFVFLEDWQELADPRSELNRRENNRRALESLDQQVNRGNTGVRRHSVRVIITELFTPDINDVQTAEEAERFEAMFGDFGAILGDHFRTPQSNSPAYVSCIVRLENLEALATDSSLDFILPGDYDEIPEDYRDVVRQIGKGLAGEVAMRFVIPAACELLNPCNLKKYPHHVGPLPSSRGMDSLYRAIGLPPYTSP